MRIQKAEQKMAWILLTFFIFSSLIPFCFNGIAGNYATKDGNTATFHTSNALKFNEAIVENSAFNVAETDSLCLRMHNNTAFMGVQPILRLVLYSASECRRKCIDLYPECAAVMFYYLHERDEGHICYFFNKNSVHPDVALVPEKPMKQFDMIKSLEIVSDCHQFDPFPPLFTNFTTSTDKVSKKKRDVGYNRPIEVVDPWSQWSECSPRSGRQVRSQLCEYGRNIERRRCSGNISHHTSGYGLRITSYAPSINISISYPPYPYQHPHVTSDEYKKIMSSHSEQMVQSCCYWQGYPRPATSDQKMQISDQCSTTCHTSEKSIQPSKEPQQLHYGKRSEMSRDGGVSDKTTKFTEWSRWSEWSFCSATCGIGVIQRYRICNTDRCTGENVEWRTCEHVVPCIASWAQWTSWSACSVTCGMGKTTRSRYCYLGLGYCNGSDYETAKCEKSPCPGWGQWEAWSQCSTTCGTGSRKRTRICTGDYCLGDTYQQTSCHQAECDGWSGWYEWSACSVSCGEGVIIRERVCIGRDCVGESNEQKTCVQPACSTWQEWSKWSTCSAKCNYGVTSRRRLCSGNFCPGKRLEVMPCHAGQCVMWSAWQEWSECSVTCGAGVQQRYRTCIGENCPGNAKDVQYCDAGVTCPHWTKWSTWSRCSHECGIGQRTRYRECISVDESVGSCKGAKSETAVCLEKLCCEWTTWASWTPCSHKCGEGRSSRTRMCLRLGYEEDDSSCNGLCYGDFREDKTCTEQPSCATLTYPTVCIPASEYSAGSFSTILTPEPGKPCPSGYIPVYVPTPPLPADRKPDHSPTLATPDYAHLPTVPSGYVPQLSTAVLPSPSHSPSTPGYVPPAPGYVPPAPGYVPSAPGYVPSAPSYVRPRMIPGNTITHSVHAVPAVTVIEIGCHWAEWYQWSACEKTCHQQVRRRSRYCVGEVNCICSGIRMEEMDCVLPKECNI